MPLKYAIAATAASQTYLYQAPVATRQSASLATAQYQGLIPQDYAMGPEPVYIPVETPLAYEEDAGMSWLGFGSGILAAAVAGTAIARHVGGKPSEDATVLDELEAGMVDHEIRAANKVSMLAVEAAAAGKQDFLEAEPYWDMSGMPNNTYKPKEPFTGKIISCKRIVGPEATGETCHIIMNHEGKMPYWEGQSYGVVPPGTNPKNGKPNSVRLYSIASSRYGDDMAGTTTSLCVRRATYWCPELKADDPAKKGVCSNYLCDSKPGEEVKLTGPTGKAMLMPEKDASTDIIMVATGTGIAPYRSFLRRLFVEKTPFGADYKGLAWLFLGVANTDALLYDDEWQEIKKNYPDNFRLDYALSREQTNADGGKMYIQDKVKEYADEVFDRMDKGAHIYFCGLKGMMPGITEMLEGVAKAKGKEWEDVQKAWKKNGQWHVEVY
jgi:ferredoxin--NADP+ reductase